MNVIIHCSDSRYGNAALITKWHLERGFNTIGYHYVILNGLLDSDKFHRHFDGYIETGRPLDDDHIIDLDEKGAHVRGYNRSVGICLIGRSGEATEKQKHSLLLLATLLKKQYDGIELYQHSDFDHKKWYCAGLNEKDLQYVRDSLA